MCVIHDLYLEIGIKLQSVSTQTHRSLCVFDITMLMILFRSTRCAIVLKFNINVRQDEGGWMGVAPMEKV